MDSRAVVATTGAHGSAVATVLRQREHDSLALKVQTAYAAVPRSASGIYGVRYHGGDIFPPLVWRGIVVSRRALADAGDSPGSQLDTGIDIIPCYIWRVR